MRTTLRRAGLGLYLVFLLAPVYWLLNLSFKSDEEIAGGLTLLPDDWTFDNYAIIFRDAAWYSGYLNAMVYATPSALIALGVALPAAYAFSRHRFIGDRSMLAWLLVNRVTPPAVFVLPFFELSRAFALLDTHIAVALAHCLFNVPIAVWILEGFISRVPREVDESAYLDGFSFPRFFLTILVPAIRPGVAVTAVFCFTFSWIELLLARSLTAANAEPIAAIMIRAAGAAEASWGMLAAAGVLAIAPGALIVWLARNHIARVLSLGRI